MNLDDWSKPDLEAFIITMGASMALGFFSTPFGVTMIIGLCIYVGLRLLQGMQ
jgi:hypothetical protein